MKAGLSAVGRSMLIAVVFAASFTFSRASQEDDYASVHMKWPLTTDEAESILANTKVFAGARVYLGGLPSPQVASLNVLLDSPDALTHLDRLASTVNPVGRLYALCGFQVLSRSRYKVLRHELLTISGSVDTQFGCIGSASPVAEVVRDIGHSKMGREFRKARDKLYIDVQKRWLTTA